MLSKKGKENNQRRRRFVRSFVSKPNNNQLIVAVLAHLVKAVSNSGSLFLKFNKGYRRVTKVGYLLTLSTCCSLLSALCTLCTSRFLPFPFLSPPFSNFCCWLNKPVSLMSCDSLELFLSKHLNLSFQLLTGSGVNKSNSAIIWDLFSIVKTLVYLCRFIPELS